MMILLSYGVDKPGTNFGGSGTGTLLGQLQDPSSSGAQGSKSNWSLLSVSVTSATTG